MAQLQSPIVLGGLLPRFTPQMRTNVHGMLVPISRAWPVYLSWASTDKFIQFVDTQMCNYICDSERLRIRSVTSMHQNAKCTRKEPGQKQGTNTINESDEYEGDSRERKKFIDKTTRRLQIETQKNKEHAVSKNSTSTPRIV